MILQNEIRNQEIKKLLIQIGFC